MNRRSSKVRDLERREIESLGEEIRLLRFQRRIGQRAVAKAIGISGSAVCRIENGLVPSLGAYLATVDWLWKQQKTAKKRKGAHG